MKGVNYALDDLPAHVFLSFRNYLVTEMGLLSPQTGKPWFQ